MGKRVCIKVFEKREKGGNDEEKRGIPGERRDPGPTAMQEGGIPKVGDQWSGRISKEKNKIIGKREIRLKGRSVSPIY